MSKRISVCCLLLAVASARIAAQAHETPPAEVSSQEIDVDAMARAKDIDAQQTEAGAGATGSGPNQSPTGDDTASSEPKSASSTAKGERTRSASQDALALTPPIDSQEKRFASACEARSTSMLDAAQRGDFAAATNDFDAKRRSALPPKKLGELWGSLGQFGALQARGEAHPAKGEGYFIIMTPLIFEKATLVAQVVCGSDGRIAGFHVKPLSDLQK